MHILPNYNFPLSTKPTIQYGAATTGMEQWDLSVCQIAVN